LPARTGGKADQIMEPKSSLPVTSNELSTSIEHALKSSPGFEQRAIEVSRGIHSSVLSGGSATRAVADLLHGTWLGHPLHPVLITIPIGAWSLATIFDGLSLVQNSREAARTADRLIAIGIAAAVPTALAGLADYSTIKQEAAAEGALHGMMNGGGLGLYMLSLAARRSGRRNTGLLLSLSALGLVSASGWIGGELVYRHKVGVNHAGSPSHSEDWIPVLGHDEIADGESRRVLINDDPVMVHRTAHAVYALGATCSHAGGPLEEGTVEGECVTCPWHQSVFDLRDGSVVHGPATNAQPRYEARWRRGRIEVRRLAFNQAPAESQDQTQVASGDGSAAREEGIYNSERELGG
jgi:nitrite reductase/ring-hydroxylating ferredoxin subunit/uncharacterized membrane protein